jgi:hypothetical protein
MQTYPVRRTVTDNTGRPLEATIIGRNATSITVIRKSDGARFEIPYNRLSEADQAFVVTLPLHAVSFPAPLETADSSPTDNPERGILGFRRIRLQEVDRLIRKNENILFQMDSKSVKGRSLRSENERLIRERGELAEEISDLESK